MTTKKYFALLISLFISNLIFSQKIVINEVMADNESTIFDYENEATDWLEIFNAESTEIDLTSYFLSDDEDDLKKWKFPSVTIPANGFLLIFASGKDQLNGGEIHTNFKISGDGESLFLSNSSGDLLDESPSSPMKNDQSFGRFPDGEGDFILLSEATPGLPNFTSNQLIFSQPGGFYEQPFHLKIKATQADSVFCSLDGNIPTMDNLLVQDSVFLNFKTDEPNRLSEIPTSPDPDLLSYHGWVSPKKNVDKATVIRCLGFKNKQPAGEVFNQTYFIDPAGAEKYKLPVLSLISEEENFFDDETGIYVPGDFFDDDDPEWTGNYVEKNSGWERPIHLEFYEKDGNLGFAQKAGVRIHGGKTRHAAQKTLKFYSREEYQQKYFRYQLLPQKPIDKYKHFLLRTTMGSWGGELIFKDELAAQIARNLNMEITDYQPVIVFLNGEYWGIQTIRDRPNEWFPALKFDLNPDSTSLIINGNHEKTSLGALQKYKDLLQFVRDNDLAETANYDFMKTKIDIDNYTDYFIAQTFFQNRDWPSNNLKIWRYEPSGKWRWLFYDLDAGFYKPDFNMLEHATETDPSIGWPNSAESTFLFRSLLKNEAFVNLFLTKYETYLKTVFAPSTTLPIYDEIMKKYALELPAHMDRWTFPESFESWETEVNLHLRDFLKIRPCIVAEHLNAFFENSNIDLPCWTDPEPPTNEPEEDGELFFAPNPSLNFGFLINNTNEVLEGELMLFASDGRLMIFEKNKILQPNEKTIMDFSKIPSGTYFLQFIGSEKTLKTKMIKM